MATAKTISIQELFTGNYRFVIKPYQRGYRWEKKQIEYLLKDISYISSSEEYCLQPIIVVPTGCDNEYELVDGQQRLTTLWILKELYASTHDDFDDSWASANYSLLYENKYPLQSILATLKQQLQDPNFIKKTARGQHDLHDVLASGLQIDANGTVDCFKKGAHPDVDSVIENIEAISKYSALVSNLGIQNINYFLENIFKPQNGFRRADNIKVIWYELDKNNPSEAPITVFTNVNANKIKLTNAELIKARFMHEINQGQSDDKRPKFALEWELTERYLNDDNFWHFIAGRTKPYATRIDFLLEVYFAVRGVKEKNNEFWAYDQIDKILEAAPQSVSEEWNKVRKIFYIMQDWYNDETNVIYHLLGLRSAVKSKEGTAAKCIADYYKQIDSGEKDKSALIEAIKADIKQDICGEDISFNEANVISWLNTLEYGRNNDTIRSVLLAYSIASLVNARNTYERFPFDLFSESNYDIEHINPKSQHKDPKNARQIGNLVLLDANTNRSEVYKTAPYNEKRELIVGILRHGDRTEEKNTVKYVPIGTKWVFLEAFEKKLNNGASDTVWEKHDEYIADIAKNLVELLGTAPIGQKEEAENA